MVSHVTLGPNERPGDDDLAVTVLGCSGTYAAAGNACSGYLVRGGGRTILLDAGPGTLASLQQHVRPTVLDAVFVSHSYPDHWGDIPVMRNALRYVLGHAGVPLYSTAETLGYLESVFPDGLGDAFRQEVITDGSEITIGALRVRSSRTAHPPETLGFRVDFRDRSVAYSADTGPAWSLGELGAGIDLGICEATWLDADGFDIDDLHMTAGQAGRLARADDIGRLVVTHVPPTGSWDLAIAEAADAYRGPVEPARIHHTLVV